MEKIAIYYDKRKHGNLKKTIAELARNSETYHGRSESEIARMLLMKALSFGPRARPRIDGDRTVWTGQQRGHAGGR